MMTNSLNSIKVKVYYALLAVLALVAGVAFMTLPVARADAGEGVGLTHNNEFFGSYEIGDNNGGGQVWCVDYGKAEPLASGGTKYGEPVKLDNVAPDDMRILVYALQEGKRAVDENDKVLAAAVSAVIHSSGTNQGIPFDEARIPEEVRPDYQRIIKDAPDVPNGTFLTVRTPENWTPGGKEGHQRVLEYDQIKTGVIEVMKVDATNKKPLENAEFTILNEGGEPISDPLVTKEDGTHRIHVNPGKYKVIEGKAPEGYLLNGTSSEENSKEITVEPNRAIRVTFANRPIPTITINKVDDSGQPLPGAKMRLSVDREEGEDIRLMDFVSDGRPVVVKVLPGNYVVEEIEAPEGYTKEPEQIKVAVDRNTSPEVTVVNTKESEEVEPVESTPYTEPESTTTVTVPEESKEAVVAEPAAKATPVITSQAQIKDENAIKEGGTIVDTVFYKNLVPGQEYQLETSMVCNPDGRETTNTASTTFTPTESDGSVEVEIPVTDAKCPVQTVFQVLKVDNLSVAEHKDIDDQAQTVGVLTVEKKPRVIIQSIPSGSY